VPIGTWTLKVHVSPVPGTASVHGLGVVTGNICAFEGEGVSVEPFGTTRTPTDFVPGEMYIGRDARAC
jgi:hypothetical protein